MGVSLASPKERCKTAFNIPSRTPGRLADRHRIFCTRICRICLEEVNDPLQHETLFMHTQVLQRTTLSGAPSTSQLLVSISGMTKVVYVALISSFKSSRLCCVEQRQAPL